MVVAEPFDRFAEQYDAWYQGPLGCIAFPQEVDALRPLLHDLPSPWLEVGIGTGRFAAALDVPYGIDPSLGALKLAGARGRHVVAGRGEALPFPDQSFGAIVLVVTLCFVADPLSVVREARRVLRLDGAIVLGLVLAESSWGQHYQNLAAAGHPYYRLAHFFTRPQTHRLLRRAGFVIVRERSALFDPPTLSLRVAPAREGYDASAGFTAMLARGAEREGKTY